MSTHHSSEAVGTARRAPGGVRRLGYLAAIVANLVALYLITHLYDWGVTFITEEWGDILWAVRLSIGASVVAHVIYMLYDAPPFRAVMQVILDGFTLLSLYIVLTVFPFEMGRQLWEQLWRLLLSLAMLGTVVGILVRLVRLATGRYRD